mmetsp:Transcript_29808/g.96162  ORF Transcript_29808/g.96162 Transcript_29808/m.96162 type:complete len:257 (-) Transcript_29808:27-797(-)
MYSLIQKRQKTPAGRPPSFIVHFVVCSIKIRGATRRPKKLVKLELGCVVVEFVAYEVGELAGVDAGVGGDVAGLGDEEVGAEVPGDGVGVGRGLEEFVDEGSVVAVDVGNLVHEGRADAVGLPHGGGDLGRREGLLAAEGVAGEEQDLEVREGRGKGGHRPVVRRRVASLRGDVRHEGDLASKAREVQDPPIGRRYFQIVEGRPAGLGAVRQHVPRIRLALAHGGPRGAAPVLVPRRRRDDDDDTRREDLHHHLLL